MIFLQPYQKYATFSGRAHRTEYWSFCVFLLIMYFSIAGLDYVQSNLSVWLEGVPLTEDKPSRSKFEMFNLLLAPPKYPGFSLPADLFILFSFIPCLALTARRFHDINKSGWYLLITFLPIIGILISIILGLFPSSPHENEYGPNPHQAKVVDPDIISFY